MKRTRIALGALAAAAAAVIGVPSTAAAAPVAPAIAGWHGSCAKGDFCVWSGKNGTGTRCAWNGNDPDWWGGAVQCNPHFLVSSYWNNGYKGNLDHVQVYIDTNYKTKLGKKISPGAKRTLWEGAPMRSHKWVN